MHQCYGICEVLFTIGKGVGNLPQEDAVVRRYAGGNRVDLLIEDINFSVRKEMCQVIIGSPVTESEVQR